MNIGKPLNRHFAKEDSWMINKYMKNCSASFVNKVMQAKTTLRSHYKRARLAKPTDTFGWWQGCATTAVLAPGDVSHATASRGKSFIVSSEVKHLHLFLAQELLSWVFVQEKWKCMSTEICTKPFTAASFTITQTGNTQMSTDEEVGKLCFHTMESPSGVKEQITDTHGNLSASQMLC